MGAGGGGSWKVAYADFVTAMMAFFLVMWLGAQDQKTRQSVANYFIDPSGVDKKPVKPGSVFDKLSTGQVPTQESYEGARGRSTHSPAADKSPSTNRVVNFIHGDKKRLSEWKEKAQAQRQTAAKSREVLDFKITATELAVEELARSLRSELTKDVSKTKNSLQQDLLIDSFNEVNWKQLAEDLLFEP